MNWTRRRPPRLLAMGSNGLVSRVRTHSTPLGQARSPVRPVPRSRGHRAMRRRCRGAGPCRGRRRLPACARPPPARGSVITSSTRRRAIPSVSASPSRCVNADRPGCSDRAPNSAPPLAVVPGSSGNAVRRRRYPRTRGIKPDDHPHRRGLPRAVGPWETRQDPGWTANVRSSTAIFFGGPLPAFALSTCSTRIPAGLGQVVVLQASILGLRSG